MVVSFAITNIPQQLVRPNSKTASVPPLYQITDQHSADWLLLILHRQLPMEPQPAVVQFSSNLTHATSCDAEVASHFHWPLALAEP
jgi:hypothetical protein